MIGDENYNQTKRVRDWTKNLLESGSLTDEQRKCWELSLAIADAMLEMQALPEEASREEFLAKATVVGDLQQKGYDLGLLIPGGEQK